MKLASSEARKSTAAATSSAGRNFQRNIEKFRPKKAFFGGSNSKNGEKLYLLRSKFRSEIEGEMNWELTFFRPGLRSQSTSGFHSRKSRSSEKSVRSFSPKIL
jgi:hypothetical protein